MPSLSRTPEALLGRNDSKNPSKTCKGITSNGRTCRRALGKYRAGVVAIFEEEGTVQEADFYCWQHKDQAEARVQEENEIGRKTRRRRKSAELFPLQERSSIDTLVQRLGIRDDGKKEKNKIGDGGGRVPQRTSRMDFAINLGLQRQNGQLRPEQKKKPGFWASLCCIASDQDDYVEIVRHRRRTEQQASRPQSEMVQSPRQPKIPSESRPSHKAQFPARSKPISTSPANRRTTSNPQTGHFLSLIPQHCSPQTTSSLLAELSKPISAADEDGYIYIFWLTPQAKDAPAEATAKSLLSPPDRRERRISDVMTEYSYDGSDSSTSRGAPSSATKSRKKTIMLKIGRANNVTRRMNEWQRQCGYKLNLVRWYPYVPSSSSPQPSPGPSLYPDLSRPAPGRRQSDAVRKVPCVKRVERLIHLELAEQQVKRQCATCGKEHREWFEVEASQDGVRAVDECVRRWVEWAEGLP